MNPDVTMNGLQFVAAIASDEVERLKRLNKILYGACQMAFDELDNVYDVDLGPDYTKESPFTGCGEVMRVLKTAMDAGRA
jgi:hypothetical protein